MCYLYLESDRKAKTQKVSDISLVLNFMACDLIMKLVVPPALDYIKSLSNDA